MGGQGRNSPGPAALDLRRQAARGRPDALRLQHPEGVDPSLGASSPRRSHGAVARRARAQAQLRQDDLPEVLRALAAEGRELPQEEVRPSNELRPKKKIK